MKISIRATEKQKDELLSGLTETGNITFVENFAGSDNIKSADAFIDLMFEDDPSSLTDLEYLLPKTIIVNSVIKTLAQTNKNFIRINAWEGFFNKPLLEGSFLEDEYKIRAETVLSTLNKKIQWVPDDPGFVTPRIISKIINEANLALQEGVSTKEEIDAAMKLGTSYPFGPFEWAEKIGTQKIQKLQLALDGRSTINV
jgi:3-hydroxybutyryl-CoA dehydrogenase